MPHQTLSTRFISFVTALYLGITLIVASYTFLHAQGTPVDCATVVQKMRIAIAQCGEINTNWVCYGETQASVSPVEYRFFRPSDRRPLPVLEDVHTQIDPEEGIVLMNLRASDQWDPVRVILFGDVDVTPDTSQSSLAITMRVENGTLLCNETPSGMVVQTDEGEQSTITINGVPIVVGSTAYITTLPDGRLVVANLEGSVSVNGVPIPPGKQVVVTVTPDGIFVSEPEDSTLPDSAVSQDLVVSLREVTNSNEAPATACTGRIDFDRPFVARNVDPGQECLYEFCIDEETPVSVQMQAVDGNMNPWLDLRLSSTLRLVDFNNDFTEENTDAQLCPKPLAPGCYTIVARTYHNTSAGRFRLKLTKDPLCTPPEPRCEVVKLSGVPMYAEPSETSSLVRMLVESTFAEPLAENETGEWLRVRESRSNGEGWVRLDPHDISCELSARDGTINPASCVGLYPDDPRCGPLPTGDPPLVPTPKPT
ncbi:MAG: hypothetical protein KDE19_11120, partial [Caldilineaceae bacterium]|nr:hypothetical protein [Caldilineaceae bacterium]